MEKDLNSIIETISCISDTNSKNTVSIQNTENKEIEKSNAKIKDKSDKKEEKSKKKQQDKENKEIEIEISNDPNDNISNPVWGIWDQREPFALPGCNMTIKGYSVAALRTNFYIPELNILLDAGLSAPNYKIENIFITHGHADHCANLPFHIYGAKVGEYKVRVHVPEDSYDYLNNFIIYGYCVSSHPDKEIKNNELYVHQCYQMEKRKANELIDIVVKNRKITIETIQCVHSIPCLGYGIIEKRSKLKEEYSTLKGKEIQELKKQGVEIMYEQALYQFLYLGDTSKEIFKEEKIKKYKYIMIECSFIFNDDYEQADKTFHIHWTDLKPYVVENKSCHFILIHFSQRYRKTDILNFFKKETEDNKIDNITAWVS